MVIADNDCSREDQGEFCKCYCTTAATLRLTSCPATREKTRQQWSAIAVRILSMKHPTVNAPGYSFSRSSRNAVCRNSSSSHEYTTARTQRGLRKVQVNPSKPFWDVKTRERTEHEQNQRLHLAAQHVVVTRQLLRQGLSDLHGAILLRWHSLVGAGSSRFKTKECTQLSAQLET